MQRYVIPFMLAALPLFAGTAVIPAPAQACAILNPPIACANLPGANPVSGLGTRFENQFQGVPGSSPHQFGNEGFFVEDRWNLNDRWSFGTPSGQDSGGGGELPGEGLPGGRPSRVLGSEYTDEELKALLMEGPVLPNTRELGRLPDDPPSVVLESDNTDVESEQGSVMDELESFFVKM